MNWIQIEDGYPSPGHLDKSLNRYYLVNVDGYGKTMAMCCINEKNEIGWYTNYYSRIIKSVTHWCDVNSDDQPPTLNENDIQPYD